MKEITDKREALSLLRKYKAHPDHYTEITRNQIDILKAIAGYEVQIQMNEGKIKYLNYHIEKILIPRFNKGG